MHKELGFCWFIFPSACFATPFHPVSSSPGTSGLAPVAATYQEMPVGGLTAELMSGGGGKRCLKEGCRANRIDGIRGKDEEKGVEAPASLPACRQL